MANEIPIDRKLSDVFAEGYDLYEKIENNDEPTNSNDVQVTIKKCIGLFEDSTRLVSLIGVFSKNENFEEIGTNNLKYLLLPYLLGQLTLKLTTGDRNEIVNIAEVYYLDFLNRCSDYEFPGAILNKSLQRVENPQVNLDELNQLIKMAQDRNTKIERYKQKKALDEEILKLKIIMARDHEDDATKREFYLKFIKSSILDVYEEIASLSMEKQMLEHMAKMKHDNPDFERENRPKPQRRPLKPIIITRDAVQKAIYGAGYPSLPTMTVAEFYDERVASGIFPDASKQPDNSLQMRVERNEEEEKDAEKAEIEKMEEVDDERLRARNRTMDDFKDEVRRGEGNRHNRS